MTPQEGLEDLRIAALRENGHAGARRPRRHAGMQPWPTTPKRGKRGSKPTVSTGGRATCWLGGALGAYREPSRPRWAATASPARYRARTNPGEEAP
jgi:hypothetical protein